MGNYTSIEELKNSPELDSLIHSAIDTIFAMEHDYHNEVKEVKRVNVSAIQSGKNEIKGFMIAGPGTTIKLSQTAILDTVMKTSYYANMLSSTNGDVEVKLIAADMLNMTENDNCEKQMPDYSNAKSVMGMLGFDVESAEFDFEGKVVNYRMNGDDKYITMEKLYELLTERFKGNIDERINNIDEKVKNLVTNIEISTRNVSSNEIEIRAVDVVNSYIDISQYNESRIELIAAFENVAKEIDRLKNKSDDEVKNEVLVNKKVDDKADESDVVSQTITTLPTPTNSNSSSTKIYLVIIIIIIFFIIIYFFHINRTSMPNKLDISFESTQSNQSMQE